LPADVKPTFSSNVVEQYLHLIPGLTSQYIYMNDDYMIDRETHPSDFFTRDHGVKLYLSPSPVGEKAGGGSDWFESLRNTISLIGEVYEGASQHIHFLKHAPYALHKEAMQGVHHRFESELLFTSHHRIRNMMDVLMLYLHYAYVMYEGRSGGGIRTSDNGLKWEIVDTTTSEEATFLYHWSSDISKNAKAIHSIQDPLFLTINDGRVEASPASQVQLEDFYYSRYGHLAPAFEKQTVS
jgi:hypothetical protein